MSAPMLKKCVVLATGGTIAGWAEDPSQAAYQAASQPVTAVLADLSPGTMVWETEQVAQVDSSAMTPALWLRLQVRLRHWLAQSDVAGVIVTHGTDTLEETAFFLHHTLPTQGKPVVLTGAMRAANHSQADGPDNLRAARDWVAQAQPGGVWVVMAGQAHHPHWVQKVIFQWTSWPLCALEVGFRRLGFGIHAGEYAPTATPARCALADSRYLALGGVGVVFCRRGWS